MNKKGRKTYTIEEKFLIEEGFGLARFIFGNSDRTVYEVFPEMKECNCISDLLDMVDYTEAVIRMACYFDSVEPGDIIILPNECAALVLSRNNNVEDRFEFIYIDEKGNIGSTEAFYHTDIKLQYIEDIKERLRRDIHINVEKWVGDYGKKCSSIRNDLGYSV